mmetsp:Transcript_68408/g.157127  ORF Transcript_68408/g.157127 Transcript_68408/m.157127 type:complete len:309 (+) Transcript_68408:562-1488(+)
MPIVQSFHVATQDSPDVCSAGAADIALGAAEREVDSAVAAALETMDKQVLFPTVIFKADLKKALGQEFPETLAKLAVDKYKKFRDATRKRDPRVTEANVNNEFFNWQETDPSSWNTSEAKKKWGSFYQSPEMRGYSKIARAAAVQYLRRLGTDVTPDELEKSWLVMWAAVYPPQQETSEEPKRRARHGYHTHQESVVSGVLYVKTQPGFTPMTFADPRGAPPIEDYEQYQHDDDGFEPKAPFHRTHMVFPEPGELVLFPSWLVHKVPPHSSTEWRVAIPFNFHLGSKQAGATVWDGWARTSMVKFPTT